jgi:hypothetical protein
MGRRALVAKNQGAGAGLGALIFLASSCGVSRSANTTVERSFYSALSNSFRPQAALSCWA